MNIIKSLKPPPLGFASSKPKSHEFPTTKKWNLGLQWNRCCCFVGWNSLLEFITSMGPLCTNAFLWNFYLFTAVAFLYGLKPCYPLENCINLLGLFKNRTNVQSNLQGEVLQVAKLDRRHKRKDSPRIGVGLCDHQLAVSFVSTLTHEEDDFPSKGGPKWNSNPDPQNSTLYGTSISHRWKRKIIFKIDFSGDMLASRRVTRIIP